MTEAQQKVTAYIAAQPSPQREICQSLRDLIRTTFPQLREEFKWNFPLYYHAAQRICLISAFKHHVTVELFYGVLLDDVCGRITGAGKRTRHIKITSLEEIDAPILSICYARASHAPRMKRRPNGGNSPTLAAR